MPDTLSIIDNRTGKRYEVPVKDGTIRAMDLRQIKVADDDFGLMTYDPAFTNTASCRSAITYIDGDQGILEYRGYPIEQLAEKSTYLEVAYLLLFGDAAHVGAARLVAHEHHHAHDAAREHQASDARLPLRRAPDGRVPLDGRCALDLLSRRQARRRRGGAAPPVRAPDRQDADRRGLRLPALDRPLLRLPGQRALLRRQLPEHAVQDDRGEVPREPGARARARGALHPPRRPRAELRHQRDARHRQLAGRSLLVDGGRGGRALRPAPRRRQRGRASRCSSRSARWPTCRRSSRR